MSNEMGNNNVSGLKEEEKSVVEEGTGILSHESVNEDDVKGEDSTVLEVEGKDFKEKDGDGHIEKQTFNEQDDIEGENTEHPIAEAKEQNETELKPPSESIEISTEANDAASLGSGVANASCEIDDNHEKPNVEDNFREISEHPIEKETLISTEDNETSNSTADLKSEPREVDLLSDDQHEAAYAESVDDCSKLLPVDNEKLVGLGSSFQAEDREMTEKGDPCVVSEGDDQNLGNEFKDLVTKTEAAEEENFRESEGLDDKCEVFSPKEAKQSLPSDSLLKAFPQSSSLFQEVSEPLEESILLSEEKKLVTETEHGDQADLKADGSIAPLSELLTTELDHKTNEKESVIKFGSKFEEPEGNKSESQVGYDNKSLELDSIEQPEESDGVSVTLRDLETVSTVLHVTDYNQKDDRPTTEIEDQYQDLNPSDMTEQCISLPLSTKHVQDLPPQVLDYEANENSKELPHENVLTASAIIGASETPPLFHEENAKAQKIVEKLITKSSSETSSTNFLLRKSPSFHFDLSVVPMLEESDQTPLLCQDKTVPRSLSSRGDTRFFTDNVQNEFSTPNDEAMSVEEKTIRMERSDSEKPNAPFLSLLEKEENAEIIVEQEKQDSHVEDKKASKNTWTVTTKQIALTSPRDSAGKRRPWPSLFTTCICCANAIP